MISRIENKNNKACGSFLFSIAKTKSTKVLKSYNKIKDKINKLIIRRDYQITIAPLYVMLVSKNRFTKVVVKLPALNLDIKNF